MPSLQDIDRFKRILDSLGGESRVLEERGEHWEEVETPDEDPSLELGALLDGLQDEIGAGEADAEDDILPDLELESLFGNDEPEDAAEIDIPDTDDPTGDAFSFDSFDQPLDGDPPENLPEDLSDEELFPEEFTDSGDASAEDSPVEDTPADDGSDLDDFLSAFAGADTADEEPEAGTFGDDGPDETPGEMPDETFDIPGPDETPEEFSLDELLPEEDILNASSFSEEEEQAFSSGASGDKDDPDSLENFDEVTDQESADAFDSGNAADDDFSLPDEFAMPVLDEEDEETGIMNLPDADSFDADGDGGEEGGEDGEDLFSLPEEDLSDGFEAGDTAFGSDDEPEADGGEFSLDLDKEDTADAPADPFAGGMEEEILFDEDAAFDAGDAFPGAGSSDSDDSFDDGGMPSFSMPMDDEDQGSGDDSDLGDLAGVDDLETESFEIDEFNLGDIGEHFGIGDDEEYSPAQSPSDDLNPATAVSEKPGAFTPGVAEPAHAADEEIRLSDDEFRAIQETLSRLPRNVKIAVEELIGEQSVSGDRLGKLIGLLVRGESARVIASHAGTILGKKLQVPKGYERRSGHAFEDERSSFGYIFRENIFPILRAVVLGVLAVAFITFVSYEFAYRPLRANHLYTVGYDRIAENDFQGANISFDAASKVRPIRRWYYRYAEAFTGKRQYYLAEEKYEQLLDRWPTDRDAVLAWANLETYSLADYEKADELLGRILDREMYDYDALLARGDNFLEWADAEDGDARSARFEDARLSYATLLQQYGDRDQILFRMLTYFIRTDNRQEVLRLKDHFQAKKKVDLDAAAYAELGGYLIDHRLLDEVSDILFRALEEEPGLPEIHYHLARYFRDTKSPGEEEKALTNARELFEQRMPLAKRRLAMLVDTYNRSGEGMYRKREFLTAEQYYRKGIDLYEDARERRILGRSEQYGRLYANLGDVYYYASGEYDEALEMFEKAEDNLFRSPVLKYKKGFVHYRNDRLDDAMLEFYAAADGFSENPNLLFATANTLSRRGDQFAAQGYYHNLLDILERDRRQIRNLRIDEDPRHRAVVEFLMRSYNNLGVTLDRLARQTGDRGKSSEGMVYLTYSSDYWDLLSRNPESLERGQARNLAFLNTRGILYPLADYELQIYDELPEDMEAEQF